MVVPTCKAISEPESAKVAIELLNNNGFRFDYNPTGQLSWFRIFGVPRQGRLNEWAACKRSAMCGLHNIFSRQP